MIALSWISISAIAAIMSLDTTAFGQLMLARPMVCGPVFGYLLGDVKAGMWVGMIVELFWARALPMGAAVPPDTTAITILTLVWGLEAGHENKRALIVVAFLFATYAGVLSRQADLLARRLNVQVLYAVDYLIAQGKTWGVTAGVIGGLLVFFLKAFVFYILIIPVGNMLVSAVHSLLNDQILQAFSHAWKVLPVAGFVVMLKNFPAKTKRIV